MSNLQNFISNNILIIFLALIVIYYLVVSADMAKMKSGNKTSTTLTEQPKQQVSKAETEVKEEGNKEVQ